MSNLTNNTAELRAILAAVNALPEAGSGGGITPTGTKTITENGEDIDVTNYAAVNVRVPSEEPVLQEGSATPTKSQQTINPPSGVDGFSKFVVNKIPDSYIIPSGSKTITANGNGIDVKNYATVNVNVPTSGGSGGDTEDLQYCVLNNYYLSDAQVPPFAVIYFRSGWTWSDFIASTFNRHILGSVEQWGNSYLYKPDSAEQQPVALLRALSDGVYSAQSSNFLVTDWDTFTFTRPSDAMIPGHTYHWD